MSSHWTKLSSLTLVALGVLGFETAAARADFITPTGVTASGYYGTNTPLFLLDSSMPDGMNTSHPEFLNKFWHAGSFGPGGVDGYRVNDGAPAVANQYLIFTLPGTYDLTQIGVWQFNQIGQLHRGVSQYDLQVSADGVNYTAALSNQPLVALDAPGGTVGQTAALAQNGVRFVKLNIDSTFSGEANEYVGLNEVRFEGTLVSAGPVLNSHAATESILLPRQPSSVDLLQGKIANSNSVVPPSDGNISQLTDGIGSNDFSHRVFREDSPAGTSPVWQLTYSAAQLGLAAGESINVNEINVFSYNTDFRNTTDFDVLYTLNGVDWQYAFIGAANVLTTDTSSGDMRLSSLAREDAQDFITGAVGLRFDFRPADGLLHSALVEIDVFGTAVPEPSSCMLMLAGTMFLARRARRGSQLAGSRQPLR